MLLIASNNQSKLAEIRALIPGIRTASPADVGLEMEMEEDGRSFFDNAFLKAAAFARASGLVALADDSGLEIDGAAVGTGSQYVPPVKGPDGAGLLLYWRRGDPTTMLLRDT